jgi:hypothetical protein
MMHRPLRTSRSAGSIVRVRLPDKSVAPSAAFVDRFAIGVVIGCVQLPWPGWATGLTFGLLLSLPSAIITKAYAPVLVVGALGGLIIGGVIHGWLPRA